MTGAAIGWALEALAASTVLMALVLLLRTPVRRAFGPDVAYALWLLPPLRLLLPPLPAAWREIAVAPIGAARETITLYITAPLTAAPAAAAAAAPAVTLAHAAPFLAASWIAGSVVFLAWHALQHRRFCRRMLDQQIRGSEIDGGIRLIETAAASGPVAFGIIYRYVAFPRDFVERYDRDERDLALAHELGHHARGDLIANWAALGVLALHWFNPIAWRAFRAFRADQEIANDARVLAGLSAIARHSYACAIVKSAHGGAVSVACHLHTINDLKGRLKMLTTDKTSRARLIGGTAAIALLTLAGLGATASGTQAAEVVRTKIEKTTGMRLSQLDVIPPAPPAPPVAPGAAQTATLPPPPAPPLPPTTLTLTQNRDVETTTSTTGGKTVRRVKVVMRDKDGTVHTENYDGAEAMTFMPEITADTCKGRNKGKEMVLNDTKGGKRMMIICTDRIEAAAAQGAAMAANSAEIERNALQSALAGLRSARAGIDRNTGMSAEQRAEALKGIDEAIAEVSADMAKAD